MLATITPTPRNTRAPELDLGVLELEAMLVAVSDRLDVAGELERARLARGLTFLEGELADRLSA